jgi:tetratricopeptide (TPR) repeat protein
VISSLLATSGAGAVSVIPKEIPDFGNSLLAPRQNPEFKPGSTFTTEDYFVWSRLDGRTSLREVILMVGLGIEKSIAILRKLRRSGAVLLPGEDSAAISGVVAAARTERKGRTAPVAAVEAEPDPAESDMPDLGRLSPDEEATLAEDVALLEREKRRIIQMMRLVAGGDYFAVLGVPRTAEKREFRRAYFRLSKEFHPDRHYKQSLGSFGPMLSIIFNTATEAFQELNDDEGREAHLAELTGSAAPARGARPSAPGPAGTNPAAAVRTTGPTFAQSTAPARSPEAAEAADLFARACEREVGGDAAGALRMFRAAIRIDSQPRYLRRAAKCALGFGQLAEAQAYAEKAMSLRADDASYARLLAEVLRAGGRLSEAEATLVRALDLPSTGDALARELEGDLAAVRAALASRPHE